MGANTFGKLLAVTTFGESHGPAIGCVIDGCPPDWNSLLRSLPTTCSVALPVGAVILGAA